MTTETKIETPTQDAIKEQIQVYASAWSLVGSRFDCGDGIDNARKEKKVLFSMVSTLFARIKQLKAENTELKRQHAAEQEAIGAGGVSALRSPSPVPVPLFSLVASRKLAELQARGYEVCGYAVERAADGPQGAEFGFVTNGGFVGWWSGFDHRVGAPPVAQPDVVLPLDQLKAKLSGLQRYSFYVTPGAFHYRVPDANGKFVELDDVLAMLAEGGAQ